MKKNLSKEIWKYFIICAGVLFLAIPAALLYAIAYIIRSFYSLIELVFRKLIFWLTLAFDKLLNSYGFPTRNNFNIKPAAV